MSDPLKAVKDKIDKLQQQVIKLEEDKQKYKKLFKKWQTKYFSAEKKIKAMEAAPQSENESELEHLRIENGRLLNELNSYKRNNASAEKIREIKKILGVMEWE